MSDKPHFGFTRHGLAVHASVTDHHPAGTGYQRFNKAVALFITRNVGTMTCFWLFSLLALLSLPATLVLVGWLPQHWLLPAFMMSLGFIYLIQWIAQSYIQLVLLPALMVGQNLQNAASDARAAKQFEDTELIADRLDTHTQGGLTEILGAVTGLRNEVGGLAAAIRAVGLGDPKTSAKAPAKGTGR